MTDPSAQQVIAALEELVVLHDGPRNADYEARKPHAWQAARDALTAGYRLLPPGEPAGGAVIHADFTEILKALGLGTHARPTSMHKIVHNEILPTIRKLRQ